MCVLLYYVCVFEQISLHFETFARLTKNLAAATAALWADANSRGTLWTPLQIPHFSSPSLSFPPSLSLVSLPTNWNCLCAFRKLWSRRRNLIESAWKCQASYDLPLPLPPMGSTNLHNKWTLVRKGAGGSRGIPPGRLQMVHIKYSLRCHSVRWSKCPEQKRGMQRKYSNRTEMVTS